MTPPERIAYTLLALFWVVVVLTALWWLARLWG